MNGENEHIEELHSRIRELEDKIEALRISRRVLMNLMDAMEKETKEQLSRLATTNEKLQRNNRRYAKAVMCRNVRISELEEQLLANREGNNRTGNTFT
jgi:hypothetical protein